MTIYFFTLDLLLFFIVRFFQIRHRLHRGDAASPVKPGTLQNIFQKFKKHINRTSAAIKNVLRIRNEGQKPEEQPDFSKNGDRQLPNLLNELADVMDMKIRQNDLIPFLGNILEIFKHLFDSKDIRSTFSANKESIILWYDPDQLYKAVYNLLINAYNFTPNGFVLNLVVEENETKVDIKIVGAGIAPENPDQMFVNPFHVNEYNSSTMEYGLRHALAKRTVGLHKGSISVIWQLNETGQNSETCFTVSLLTGKDHFDEGQITYQDNAVAPVLPRPLIMEDLIINSHETERKYMVLLVVDNEKKRSDYKKRLMGNYYLLESANGSDGWEMALEHIPDMVISDIMMNEIDGLDMCREIKSDERTSHIPIILLTATASIQHQIKGLEIGVDCYIAKPSSIQILELKIKNLFRAREVLYEKYSRQIILEPQHIIIDNHEEEFLNKVIQLIEENIEDREFGVAELSTLSGMSISVLYKKLKAVTNMTVNDFVKSIRLKKAYYLLQQGHFTIKEISYRVGFEDRKYFSREFKKQFGKTPSEYLPRNHTRNQNQ